MRLNKGISVNADQQVGLCPSRFLYPYMQRNKIITIAGQNDLHVRVLFQFILDASGNLHHHIFFEMTLRTDRAGVLAAMTRV